jgi:hypothetical protein
LTNLAKLLCLILELHCMAGLRDQQYSSVGRAPIKVKIESIDDGYSGEGIVALCGWQERGKPRNEWFVFTEDAARVKEGQTYSLVRSRSIRNPDPFALTCKQARVD